MSTCKHENGDIRGDHDECFQIDGCRRKGGGGEATLVRDEATGRRACFDQKLSFRLMGFWDGVKSKVQYMLAF